jgi:signal transduction histidine kinase
MLVVAAIGIVAVRGMVQTMERSRPERSSAYWTLALMVVGIAVVLIMIVIAARRVDESLAAFVRAEREALAARDVAVAASAAKSEFLARVSHELRTPLNSVIGFSNVLLRTSRGTLRGQEIIYLERIRDNGLHLLALIDEILDLARIESGKLRVVRTEVKLEQLLRETAAQLEGRLFGRDVAIAIEAPSEVMLLQTDSGKLKQVLINLLGNAIKFTERGSITLRVIADDNRRPVRIEVADTGIGIPEEEYEAIFEAFEQVDDGLARRRGGSGLGLAISKSLCQLLGYRLTVESAVGVGSTFSVVLVAGGEARGAGGSPSKRRELALSGVSNP